MTNQVCDSSDAADASAAVVVGVEAVAEEEYEDEEEQEQAARPPPPAQEPKKYTFERYQGNGKSPGPLRVVGEDGQETAVVTGAADGEGYVDVSGSQSVEDLAAQLSSLQSFQF